MLCCSHFFFKFRYQKIKDLFLYAIDDVSNDTKMAPMCRSLMGTPWSDIFCSVAHSSILVINWLTLRQSALLIHTVVKTPSMHAGLVFVMSDEHRIPFFPLLLTGWKAFALEIIIPHLFLVGADWLSARPISRASIHQFLGSIADKIDSFEEFVL